MRRLVLAGALAAAPAMAQQAAEARRELDAARAAERTTAGEAARLDAEARMARGRAEQARRRLVALTREVDAASRAERQAWLRVQQTIRLRDALSTRLTTMRAPLARLLAALVRQARRPPALALLSPASLDDAGHLRAALDTVRPAIDARASGLRAALARSATLRGQADAEMAALRVRQAELVVRRSALAEADRVAATAQADATARAALARERAQGFAEQAASLDGSVAALARGAAAAAHLATLAGPTRRPGSTGPMSAGAALYRLPVTGQVLVGAGELAPDGVRARGLTLATRRDAIAIAPAGGRIVYAGPFRAWRAIVIIDHGHGWTTLIAGLVPPVVAAGTPVGQGDRIGRAGPRVTIELRHAGRPVDVTGMAEAGR